MSQQENGNHRPRFTRPTLKKALRIAGYVVLGIAGAVALAIALGLLIQWLWNTVAANVLGVRPITYWQAVGLFVLAKLFFGGLGLGHSESNVSKPAEKECDEVEAPVPPAPGPGDFERYWQKEGRAAFAAYLQKQEQAKKQDKTE